MPDHSEAHCVNSWNASRLGWLLLASYECFGSRTLHTLHRLFGGNGDAASRVDAETLRRRGCKDAVVKKFIAFREAARAEDLAMRLDREHIRFLLKEDAEYPPLLRQIADPPLALFVKGRSDLRDLDGVAIVGTRRHTPYGKYVASWLGRDLAAAGFWIVAGMAGGIDTIVHEAALEAHGITVAVLGGGVDEEAMYPRTNLALARTIEKNGGTILSEISPGILPMPFSFPLRNRIISGLCRATIVVEAAEGSGSLITAHQALEQNRDVFAVPGPITHAQSYGTNRLLTMGAIPCTGPETVMSQLRQGYEPAVPHTHNVTDEERTLLGLLDTPLHTDEIARALREPISTICARLVALELKGLIIAQEGHVYARSRYWN